MSKPTLSVLLPNYNHARYLAGCLQAILGQSYQPTEIVVIDDASTDGSVEILQEFAQKSSLIRVVYNKKNMGAFYHANRQELTSGDYLHAAASDDRILPGFYEKAMELVMEYPAVGVCSGLSLLMDEDGRNRGLFPSAIISSKPVFLTPEEVKKTLQKYGSWFMGNATIYRRAALYEAGGFIPELRAFSDGFISHVLALKYGACFIPEPVAVWRRLPSGYSITHSSSASHMEGIIEKTTRLMLGAESPYRGLFPEKYVEDWKKRRIYWVGKAMSMRFEAQSREFLDRLSRIVWKPWWLDRCTGGMIWFLVKVQTLVIGAYLLIRSFTWPASPLMIKWLIRSLKYRRKA